MHSCAYHPSSPETNYQAAPQRCLANIYVKKSPACQSRSLDAFLTAASSKSYSRRFSPASEQGMPLVCGRPRFFLPRRPPSSSSDGGAGSPRYLRTRGFVVQCAQNGKSCEGSDFCKRKNTRPKERTPHETGPFHGGPVRNWLNHQSNTSSLGSSSGPSCIHSIDLKKRNTVNTANEFEIRAWRTTHAR